MRAFYKARHSLARYCYLEDDRCEPFKCKIFGIQNYFDEYGDWHPLRTTIASDLKLINDCVTASSGRLKKTVAETSQLVLDLAERRCLLEKGRHVTTIENEIRLKLTHPKERVLQLCEEGGRKTCAYPLRDSMQRQRRREQLDTKAKEA